MFTMFKGGAAVAPADAMPRKRGELSTAERLYRDLQAHRERQTAVLDETERAAGLVATPLAKYLVGMVEDNQAKQLEVVDAMDASLRDALYWTYSPEALPDVTGRERAAAIESLKKIIKLERDRARSARRLAKKYSGIDGGLEQALLEASAESSDSNIKLLRLIVNRLQETSEGPRVSTEWQPALQERTIAAPRQLPARRTKRPQVAA
jgi:hypothetical protein